MTEKTALRICAVGAVVGIAGIGAMMATTTPEILHMFKLKHWPFWLTLGGIAVLQAGVWLGKRARGS